MFLRKFIILNKKSDQNAKGHAKLEVRSGRGKISLNLEGLDTQLDEDDIYKGYLVSNEKSNFRNVDIGIINLTKDGRGTLDWEFNSNSVGGIGIDIENFNIVLIKLETNHSNKLEVPLGGYIHTDDKTMQIVMNKLEKEVKKIKIKEKKVEEKEILDTEEIGKIEKIEETEEAEETEEIESKHVEEEKVIEDEYGETEEIEEAEEEIQIKEEIEEDAEEQIEEIIDEEILENDVTEEQIQEQEYDSSRPMFEKGKEGFIEELQDYLINKDIINKQDLEDNYIEEDLEEFDDNFSIESESNSRYDTEETQSSSTFRNEDYLYEQAYTNNQYTNDSFTNYSQQIANYTLNILKFFKKVSPFKQEFEGYTWWEIEYDKRNIHRGFLPYYNYLVNMYYPYNCITRHATSQSQIKKHEHYIFGVVQENNKIRHYVYGIPGKFTEEDQPYGGKTGFVTWFEKEEQDENLGYWIIYIDALTGNIVRPL